MRWCSRILPGVGEVLVLVLVLLPQLSSKLDLILVHVDGLAISVELYTGCRISAILYYAHVTLPWPLEDDDSLIEKFIFLVSTCASFCATASRCCDAVWIVAGVIVPW
jgi:hypothetical protein